MFAKLLVGLIALALSSIASAEKMWEIESGQYWDGAAYSRDEGSFSHCLIGATYDDTDLIFMRAKNGGFYYGLINPNWKLPKDEVYKVQVRIDQTSYGRVEGVAIASSLIRINGDHSPKIFEHLKTGSALRFIANRKTFSFNLKGSNAALAELDSCYDKAINGGENPFASASGQTERVAYDKNLFKSAEDKETMDTLVSMTGLTNYEYVNPAGTDFSDYEYGWIEGSNVGLYSNLGKTERNVKQSVKGAIAAVVEGCDGAFGVDYHPVSKYNDGKGSIGGAYSSCEGGGNFAVVIIDNGNSKGILVFMNKEGVVPVMNTMTTFIKNFKLLYEPSY